jgi:hypothetical protein
LVLKQQVHIAACDHAALLQTFNVINEEPWQIEQARHPSDYGHDMQGFHPRIGRRQKIAHKTSALSYFFLKKRF